MKRASLLAGVLLAACATMSSSPSLEKLVEKLPSLSDIVTLENAKRALVISQQVRVIARDQLAMEVKADGTVDDSEMARISAFDRYDDMFTNAWRIMDRAVTVWEKTGERSTDIDTAYADLLNAILNPNGIRDLGGRP